MRKSLKGSNKLRLWVIVTGDRHWDDPIAMTDAFDPIAEEWGTHVVIIEGEAKGADSMGKSLAKETYGWDVIEMPANWSIGPGGGPVRNGEMLKMLPDDRPKLVLAFHKNISKSKGTWDMIKKANKAGVEVRLYGGKY